LAVSNLLAHVPFHSAPLTPHALTRLRVRPRDSRNEPFLLPPSPLDLVFFSLSAARLKVLLPLLAFPPVKPHTESSIFRQTHSLSSSTGFQYQTFRFPFFFSVTPCCVFLLFEPGLSVPRRARDHGFLSPPSNFVCLSRRGTCFFLISIVPSSLLAGSLAGHVLLCLR